MNFAFCNRNTNILFDKSLNKTFDAALGKYLNSLRVNAGLSQEYLGELMGKGQSEIAKIESGNKKINVVDFLHWISVLNLDLEDSLKKLKELTAFYFEKTKDVD